jgi:glucose 1-dehydrogenase
MDLRGKTALVTGGGVRVGRALALALAGAGCDLVVHYNRSAGPAERTREEAERLGVRAHAIGADLADAAAAEGLVAAAVERCGRLDVLVNSAAIFPPGDTLETSGAAEFDELIAVNLRAPYLLSRAFAAAHRPGAPGRIVNVLDARVRRPGADHPVYRLTKRALWALTENLALALAPDITVNAVALGAILPPPGEDESYLERLAAERVPLRRPGSPAIVAENVLHLLRQDFVTGAVLPLDGGQFL